MTALPRVPPVRVECGQSRSTSVKTLARMIAVACVASGLFGCNQGHSSIAPVSPTLLREGGLITVPETSPLRGSLVVSPVQLQGFQQGIEAPGVIEALPEKLVAIAPPLAGRVVKLHRSIGDVVRAGDALATIDSPELASAYSEHDKARASLAEAKQEFERQQALHEQDISARRDLEAAQAVLASATSEARAAADRLAQAGVGARATSRREYVLRSPIAGSVIEMDASQGAYWNDIAAPLMTVADLSEVWLSASVAEKDLAHMFVGQQARITVNAHGGRVFDAQVKYIGDTLDPDTRTIRVRVAIDNQQGLFKPGMFAAVSFAGHSRQALLIPASALLQSGLYTRVFVEQQPFRYVSRIVRVGSSVGDRVEVLEGLKTGERIVTANGVLLND